MSTRQKKQVDGKTASPYGYPFWDWVAKEDPEYVLARQPLSELSVGEGKELSIKHREMVIIGILAFRGREEGVVTHTCAGPFSTARPSASCSRRSSPPRSRAVDRPSARGCRR
jgi:hypothetical protein